MEYIWSLNEKEDYLGVFVVLLQSLDCTEG
jgi:hypothetical protein